MSMARNLMRRAVAAGGGDDITSPSHPDLLVMYDMGDTVSGSTLIDLSPNSKDGIITNAPIVTGIMGDALDFVANPVGNANPAAYVDTPLITTPGDYSICLWVDINTVRKLRGVFLGFRQNIADGGHNQFYGYYHDSQYLRISFFEGTTLNYNSGALNISDGWRFLCIVRDGAFYRLYVDATLNQSWAAGAQDLRINSLGTFSTPANRSPDSTASTVHSRWVYDTTRIFGKAIDQTEVNSLWNGGAGA